MRHSETVDKNDKVVSLFIRIVSVNFLDEELTLFTAAEKAIRTLGLRPQVLHSGLSYRTIA